MANSPEQIDREIDVLTRHKREDARRNSVHASVSEQRKRRPKDARAGISTGRYILGFSSPQALGDAIRNAAVMAAEHEAQHGEVKTIKGLKTRYSQTDRRMTSFDRITCYFLRNRYSDLSLPPDSSVGELSKARSLTKIYRRFISMPERQRYVKAQSWGTSKKDLEDLIRVFHARWKQAKAQGL